MTEVRRRYLKAQEYGGKRGKWVLYERIVVIVTWFDSFPEPKTYVRVRPKYGIGSRALTPTEAAYLPTEIGKCIAQVVNA